VGRPRRHDGQRTDQQLGWKSKYFRFNTRLDVEFPEHDFGNTRNYINFTRELAPGVAE
jgi:hypothetical protein